MKESDFWSSRLRPRLAQACRDAGMLGHFERVENAVGTGTPDVDYCVAGVAGKIELKYAVRHPVRASTPVLGRGNGLRRSQVIWIIRRNYVGGQVFVAIGSPHNTWFITTLDKTPDELAALEMLSAGELDAVSVWHNDRDDWSTLPRVLANR